MLFIFRFSEFNVQTFVYEGVMCSTEKWHCKIKIIIIINEKMIKLSMSGKLTQILDNNENSYNSNSNNNKSDDDDDNDDNDSNSNNDKIAIIVQKIIKMAII